MLGVVNVYVVPLAVLEVTLELLNELDVDVVAVKVVMLPVVEVLHVVGVDRESVSVTVVLEDHVLGVRTDDVLVGVEAEIELVRVLSEVALDPVGGPNVVVEVSDAVDPVVTEVGPVESEFDGPVEVSKVVALLDIVDVIVEEKVVEDPDAVGLIESVPALLVDVDSKVTVEVGGPNEVIEEPESEVEALIETVVDEPDTVVLV